jgi:hypothetical protein
MHNRLIRAIRRQGMASIRKAAPAAMTFSPVLTPHGLPTLRQTGEAFAAEPARHGGRIIRR